MEDPQRYAERLPRIVERAITASLQTSEKVLGQCIFMDHGIVLTPLRVIMVKVGPAAAKRLAAQGEEKRIVSFLYKDIENVDIFQNGTSGVLAIGALGYPGKAPKITIFNLPTLGFQDNLSFFAKPDLPKLSEFKKIIEDRMAQAKNASSKSEPRVDITSELVKLKRLLDAGVLT